MHLKYVTITGADESVSPEFLLEQSKRYPWVEWGILFSNKKIGTNRYPGMDWMKKLISLKAKNPSEINLSAHLCGDVCYHLMFMLGGGLLDKKQQYTVEQTSIMTVNILSMFSHWGLGLDDFHNAFDRVQLNFNATTAKLPPEQIKKVADGFLNYTQQAVITQHNENNSWVWKAAQSAMTSPTIGGIHHVLMDASGGKGETPAEWSPPIAGVLTGYAGGISPTNVYQTLDALDKLIPEGLTWIDMESGVRTEDDQFSVSKVSHILRQIAGYAEDRKWLL